MRRFQLVRAEDVSGTSGTGIVAEGCEFTSGACALTWLTPYRVVAMYESIKAVVEVHGHGGRTTVRWLDEEAAP